MQKCEMRVAHFQLPALEGGTVEWGSEVKNVETLCMRLKFMHAPNKQLDTAKGAESWGGGEAGNVGTTN